MQTAIAQEVTSSLNIFTMISLFFLILAAIVLFYLGYRFFLDISLKRAPSSKKNLQKNRTEKTPCPLCNSMLYDGENIVSRVYKTNSPKDQACTIHGCPHCFPNPEMGVKRNCPVCHKIVPLKGHLDAHLFSRGSAKKHIHITGCTECHKKR